MKVRTGPVIGVDKRQFFCTCGNDTFETPGIRIYLGARCLKCKHEFSDEYMFQHARTVSEPEKDSLKYLLHCSNCGPSCSATIAVQPLNNMPAPFFTLTDGNTQFANSRSQRYSTFEAAEREAARRVGNSTEMGKELFILRSVAVVRRKPIATETVKITDTVVYEIDKEAKARKPKAP